MNAITEERISNILAEYTRATEKDKADGVTWYSNVRARCERLASKHGKSLETVVGVYAVLSPGTTWAVCDSDTEGLLAHGAKYAVTTYRANKDKALKIKAGRSIFSVTSAESKKVRAFYQAILGDISSVCVDRHAGAVAEGRALTHVERKALRRRKYDDIVKAYTIAAGHAGVSPRDLQAITWTSYRRNLTRKLVECSPF